MGHLRELPSMDTEYYNKSSNTQVVVEDMDVDETVASEDQVKEKEKELIKEIELWCPRWS